MILCLAVLAIAIATTVSDDSSSSSSSSSKSSSSSLSSLLSDLVQEGDWAEALLLDLEITQHQSWPYRVKPSSEGKPHFRLGVHVKNIAGGSWEQPMVKFEIGTPKYLRHVDGNSGEFGTLRGLDTDRKPQDYRGNGVGRKRLSIEDYISRDAALRNGPVDDIVVRMSHQQEGARTLRRGDSDVFWVNADFPYGQGEEGLISIKVTPLHKNEPVVLASRVFFVDVTCSDGVFCNGQENFVDGKCSRAKFAPCDDKNSCTRDICDEDLGECHWETRPGCDKCYYRGDPCIASCEGRECGTDGCTSNCGACADGLACKEGKCVAASGDGTCSAPFELLPASFDSAQLSHDTPYDFVIQGTSGDSNEITPSCNRASEASESIYTFQVPKNQTWGIMAKVSGHRIEDGEEVNFDTVLELRRSCRDIESTVVCADDSTPPGNFGSGWSASISAGRYYLFVDGYSIAEYGDFNLTVRLYRECVPTCDGALCGGAGTDTCGGDCGACDDGLICNSIGRCVPESCVPNCDGKQCGDNGCGGVCGVCGSNLLCNFFAGKCIAVGEGYDCNTMHPICAGGCPQLHYCAANCTCVHRDAPLPDFITSRDVLKNEIVLDKRRFVKTSCAVDERCVGGLGVRRLLRFSLGTVNQGHAAFQGIEPKLDPSHYFFSPCHAHYHFANSATYELLELKNNRSITLARKPGSCLLDAYAHTEAPWVDCEPYFDCSAQGISPGWGDLYGNSLDCQWIDITGVPPGTYRIKIVMNPARTIAESCYENNVATHLYTIPADPDFVADALSGEAIGERNAIEATVDAVIAEMRNRISMPGRPHARIEAGLLIGLWRTKFDDQCGALGSSIDVATCREQVHAKLDVAVASHWV